MSTAQNSNSTSPRPLRVWPGVVIVAIQIIFSYLLPAINPEWAFYAFLGGAAGTLLVLIWWLFFSRARWLDRILVPIVVAGAMYVMVHLVHESIANGAMGMLYYVLTGPFVCLAVVIWAWLTRNSSLAVRRVTMVIAVFLGCSALMPIRTGGFTGGGDNDFHWRWTPTPEEKLLAQKQEEPEPIQPPAPEPPKAPEQPVVPETPEQKPTEPAPQTQTSAAQVETTPAEWPGFRGPNRDSIVRGVRLDTDWTASPPKELWRKPIGPGWSSFGVHGDRIFTQEQRGDHEVVACYNKKSGKPVWTHLDATRFWESNAGAGPRGTPALHNGRVYAFGATGILNALSESDGSVVWSRNVASDTKTETPGWGFSASPLVIDDMVIIAVAGQLAAYDLATGKSRWFGPKGGTDYSSPHPFTADGVPQILMMSKPGVRSVVPATGKLLWEHSLPAATRITQPAVTSDGDLLLSEGERHGIRRIAVTRGSNGWTVQERWTSIGMKPYFNDLVVHNGHAFGFDGNILSCIDVKDGKRKWKGGKYGYGQLILLADQDLLLILSEAGELALVKATTDQFTELARFKAIDSKTWNHPVLVGDTVLVRNGEEMAAFRLALAHE